MGNPLAADLDHVLAEVGGVWNELRGRRVFITGGTGFLGCWLLESFAWANDRLGLDATAVVLTRDPAGFRDRAPHLAGHPAIRLCPGDVRSFEFPPGEFSHAIHAAAGVGGGPEAEDPLVTWDTLVQGTRRTLEFARGSGVEKLLFVSSGAVYGRQPPGITHLPESYPADPRSVYGRGKRAAEWLCGLYAARYGFEAKIARCFAFVGAYLPLGAHFAVGSFIRDGLQGRAIRVRSDGSPYRSFLYAADWAAWLWTILCRGEGGRPYNVGSEDSVQLAGVAELVSRAFQPQPEVRIAGAPEPGGPAERYVPSTARARTELGLRQTVDLPEAVRRTIEWHRHAQE